jgi:nitroreductase
MQMSEARIDAGSDIEPELQKRWSPYAYSDRPVPDADLVAILEAARWAPSSYNEQPWRYILATKKEPEAFAKALSCLVEGNQVWAKQAPVLLLALTVTTFARNDKPNKAAQHDLGLAAGNICVEATARGLHVHQMIGIEPDKVREHYGVPPNVEPLTAIAIGYLGENPGLPDALHERDRAVRTRKPLSEIVFGSAWGNAASLGG